MRIAIIAPPWAPVPPKLYGGIELVVDLQARGFTAAGHDVVLVTTGDSTSPVPRRFLLEEAEHERIGMAVPELRHALWAYDQVQDADVVHDHTMAGPVYARVAFPGLPVVTTIHGPFNQELVDIYARICEEVPIVAVSHAQAGGAGAVRVARVIHHGIDAGQFPFGDGDGGYCLYLGRMSPDKGAHRAIEVAQAAGRRLIMAAKMREPWEMAYFRDQVEPHLSESVVYEGEVPHERKVELLAGAEALLFPIRWAEPFGMVMLEAFACGTPVIALDYGSVPEVVTDGLTGFVCESEHAMVSALGRVAEIDRRDCRAAVEGPFSATRMADEHLALYQDVCDGRLAGSMKAES